MNAPEPRAPNLSKVGKRTAYKCGFRDGVASVAPPPVRVKDLVWRFYSDVEHQFGWGVYDAHSAIGLLTIEVCREDDLTIEVCGEDDEGLRFHVQQLSATYVSLDDAKDAYYEMYAARIFAYLEPAMELTP